MLLTNLDGCNMLLALLINLDVPFGEVLAPWSYAAFSGVESTVQR
jgi:hypothetical protein